MDVGAGTDIRGAVNVPWVYGGVVNIYGTLSVEEVRWEWGCAKMDHEVRLMKRFGVVFGLVLLAFASVGEAVQSAEPEIQQGVEGAAEGAAKGVVPPVPWTLVYADGSGNSYKFWRAADADPVRFERVPVTPEQSSSGVYSGGEARNGELAVEAVVKLWKQVAALEANAEIRAEKREMGTGQFMVTTVAGMRQFIVRRGDAVTAFDTFVAGLIAP